MTFRTLAAAGAALAMVTGASDFLAHDGIGHATTPAATHILAEGVGPIINGYTWSNGIQGTGNALNAYLQGTGPTTDATAIEYGLVADWGGEVL